MKGQLTQNSRFIAMSMLGLYIILMGLGLVLETAAGSYFAGTEPLAAVMEVSVFTVWIAVGALLVIRQPEHPVGWIWLLIPLIVALDHLTWGYAYYGLFTNPGSLPGIRSMVIWNYWTGRTVGNVLLALLFLLFPTGRPLSPRWGWLAWIAGGAVAVHIPLAAIAPYPISSFPFPLDLLGASQSLKVFVGPLRWITGIIPVLCALLATFSLVVRLRRSRGVERQQLKWFVYAAAFFIPGTFLIIVSGIQETLSQSLLFAMGVIVTLISITGMAIASAIAILRYRLWDIDVIIRRTLIYGILTGLLALIYVASVVLLTTLLARLGRPSAPVVTVASTLAVAVLFAPLRRRVQELIDRRFYRQKYVAAEILPQFAVTAQSQVDLDPLAEALLKVVEKTLQPKSLSLWLKEG